MRATGQVVSSGGSLLLSTVKPEPKAFEDGRAAPVSECEMLRGADDVPALRFALNHEELEDDVEGLARLARRG